MKIIHYYSEDAAHHPAWLAYIELPNGSVLGVQFRGCTKDEVDAKAQAFWERESNMTRGGTPVASDKTWPQVTRVVANPWGERASNNPSAADNTSSGGRGVIFSGTVWVGNPKTKEKKRVPAHEVEVLMAQGWIKAGPRTQL